MGDTFNLGESNRFAARSKIGTPSVQTRLPKTGGYGLAPDKGEMQQHAKASLRDRLLASFDHLESPRIQGGLGVRIQRVEKDPYETAEAMLTDVRKNRTLQLDNSVDFPSALGGSGNPVGRPQTKAPDRPLTGGATEAMKATPIQESPAQRSQNNHITNRYRRFASSALSGRQYHSR